MGIKKLEPEKLRELVTAKDVAAAWGCSEREIQQKAREKEIPSYQIGRLIRFDPEELNAYINTCKRMPR